MPFDSAPVETDSVVLALIRAKQRIEDPANWCQGEEARDADGCSVVWMAGHAVSFCALGSEGIGSGLGGTYLDRAAKALFPEVADILDKRAAAWVNDTLGHSAVMQVYDRAIALRRAETGGV